MPAHAASARVVLTTVTTARLATRAETRGGVPVMTLLSLPLETLRSMRPTLLHTANMGASNHTQAQGLSRAGQWWVRGA